MLQTTPHKFRDDDYYRRLYAQFVDGTGKNIKAVQSNPNYEIAPLSLPYLEAIPDAKLIREAPYMLIESEDEWRRVESQISCEPVLAVDTETTGFDPYTEKTLLLQIATPYQCYIIDAVHVDLRICKSVLENPKTLLLLHNAKFDHKVLWQMAQGPDGVPARIRMGRVFDTYMAEMLLTAGQRQPRALKYVAQKYLDIHLDKEIRDEFVQIGREWHGGSAIERKHVKEELLRYAAGDVLTLFGIFDQQADLLGQEKLGEVAAIEFEVAQCVGDMELAGLRIDVEKWRQLLVESAVEEERALKSLMALLPSGKRKQKAFSFGEDAFTVDPDSPLQMVAEFRKMGIELPDTSEAVLLKTPHPAAKALLEYRGYAKIRQNYGESLLKLINPITGRIHADYKQDGAEATGRFSAENPNVQQIPATSSFRSCFISDVGYLLGDCDYDQFELRILCEESGDPVMQRTFRAGYFINDNGEWQRDEDQSRIDPHTMTAATMFGYDYTTMYEGLQKLDAVKSGKASWVDKAEETLCKLYKVLRSAAKNINFGLAYGMGAQGLAGRIDPEITADDIERQRAMPKNADKSDDVLIIYAKQEKAQALIDQFFNGYQGVKTWLDRAARTAVSQGYAITLSGRKRYFSVPSKDSPDYRKIKGMVERQGKNMPIQGCVTGDTRVFDQEYGLVSISNLEGWPVRLWDGTDFQNAHVVFSGQKKLVRIELWGGHTITCSPDHKFLVRTTSGEEFWRTPDQFKLHDRMVLTDALPDWELPMHVPHMNKGFGRRIHNSVASIENRAQLGEWLGRLASDGGTSLGSAYLLVAEHEEELVPYLESISREIGKAVTSKRFRDNRNQAMYRINISSRGLAKQLQDMGIKKEIPDFLWQSSSGLAGYIRGMFDGDGYVSPDSAVLTFGGKEENRAWAKEIQEALLLFGIRSRLTVYDATIHLAIFKADMPLFSKKVGFINSKKQEKAESIVPGRGLSEIYGKATRIKNVEFTEDLVDMFDVVNSDSGRFMANGVVTHNCNADIIKLALVYLHHALLGYDARVICCVHDEVLVEVVDSQAEEVARIVETQMKRAAQKYIKSIPIGASCDLARYWKK